MNQTENGSTNEFTFLEEAGQAELTIEERPDGFVELDDDLVDKTEVLICTAHYVIRGKISLVPGARLTDYIIDSHAFIAVTDAVIRDKQNKFVMRSAFLNLNRELIEIILPADLAVMTEDA